LAKDNVLGQTNTKMYQRLIALPSVFDERILQQLDKILLLEIANVTTNVALAVLGFCVMLLFYRRVTDLSRPQQIPL
jgi:hypothetical protein